MSGFERLEKDRTSEELLVRLYCRGDERGRPCGSEIGRVYQGNEDQLTLRGKGRVLSVEAGLAHLSLELMPHRFLPSEPGPSSSSQGVAIGASVLSHEQEFSLRYSARAREARLRDAPWGSLSVRHIDLRTMLVELYCVGKHDLRRIWGEQIRLAAIRAKKGGRSETLKLRVFSIPWPLSADPQEWPFWNYSGRPARYSGTK